MLCVNALCARVLFFRHHSLHPVSASGGLPLAPPASAAVSENPDKGPPHPDRGSHPHRNVSSVRRTAPEFQAKPDLARFHLSDA